MFNSLRNLIRLPQNISEDDARLGNILQNTVLVAFIFPIIIFLDKARSASCCEYDIGIRPAPLRNCCQLRIRRSL
jgi:hypothetical protein